MMTDTISFKEILRLIHPDVNPHLKDTGTMMDNAKLWRKDEAILYRLGVQWGVIVPVKPTPWNTTPLPVRPTTAIEDAKKKAQDLRTKVYQDLVKTQQEQKVKDEELRKAREEARGRQEDADVYAWRVKNRVFQEGDIIYIRTRQRYFMVTKQTPLRVYFMCDGKETFSLKKNVRHSSEM